MGGTFFPFPPTYPLCLHLLLLPTSYVFTRCSYPCPLLTPLPPSYLLCLHRFLLPASYAYTVSSYLPPMLTPPAFPPSYVLCLHLFKLYSFLCPMLAALQYSSMFARQCPIVLSMCYAMSDTAVEPTVPSYARATRCSVLIPCTRREEQGMTALCKGLAKVLLAYGPTGTLRDVRY